MNPIAKNHHRVFVIYVEPNGIIHPINCQFSEFFLGVDEIAVFDNDNTVAVAIKAIKQKKKNWINISKLGKFRIVNVNNISSDFPITLKPYNFTCSGLSHKHQGNIWRVPLAFINGMSETDWIKKLRSKKQVSLA